MNAIVGQTIRKESERWVRSKIKTGNDGTTDRIGGNAIKVKRAVANSEACPRRWGNVAMLKTSKQPPPTWANGRRRCEERRIV